MRSGETETASRRRTVGKAHIGVATLSERDSRAFADALARPPVPNERARRAAQKYLALYYGDSGSLWHNA